MSVRYQSQSANEKNKCHVIMLCKLQLQPYVGERQNNNNNSNNNNNDNNNNNNNVYYVGDLV